MNGVQTVFNSAVGTISGTPRGDVLAALFLILLLFGVLATGLMCVTLIRRSLRARNQGLYLKLAPSRELAPPRAFSYPMFDSCSRWLAIRGNSLAAVQEALHLHNVSPCTWADGLASAREHKLFISPPVKGWIIVVGSDLPEPADDVDACYVFLQNLSRSLGEVQFFSTNRVVNHHAWARLHEGKVIRAYAWGGETLWNEGRLTSPELELEMKCYDYFESPQQAQWKPSDTERNNADKVLNLASRWSLDPSSIEELVSREGPGVAGEFWLKH